MISTTPDQAPTTIVWAEDERISRIEIEFLWGKINKSNPACAQLIFVENGKQALEIIQRLRNEVSALITDCDMPDMNGVALLNQIRKLRWWQGKTAMFTGRYDEARGELEELGIRTNVFKKPIELGTTERVLRSVGLSIPQAAVS
jgi:CheY-like chemotaxis protein